MKKNAQTQTIAMFSMLLAVEMVLLLTPLGYIRTPLLSITLMHIPVIATGILMGPKWGGVLGLVFGLTSVWNATTAPSAASFVFSPFVTVAGVSGNWTSLIIALVPRILLGMIAGWLFDFFSKKLNRPFSACLAAAIATLCHTIMVLGLIYVCWGAQYAAALGQSADALLGLLAMTVVTNGLAETGAAALVSMALVKAIRPSMLPADRRPVIKPVAAKSAD